MTSATSFQILYDAEDTESAQHKIDARTLNISMGSMTDLILAADKRLNDGQQTVRSVMTNLAEAGSLGVSYMVMGLVPHVIDATKVTGLTGLAGAAIGALVLSLIRQLGSKRAISITKRVGTDQFVLELKDEEIVCHDSVTKLVTDPEVRSALVNTVHAPLGRKKDAAFKVLNEDGVEVICLEGEETEETKLLPRDTLLEKEEPVEEINVGLAQVNFERTKGWRVEYLGEEHAVLFED